MEWTSEWLLSKKINELKTKQNKDESDTILLNLCQRELAVLKRLKIEGIDLRGNIEAVELRIKNNSIYFLDKNEYEELTKKSYLYDAIKKIVN